MIASIVERFSDDEDAETLKAVWEAAKATLSTIPKDEMPAFVSTVRKGLVLAHDTQRRKVEEGSPVEIPACVLLSFLSKFFYGYTLTLSHSHDTQRCKVE